MVRVRAQVMMRDDSTGGWVPMGGGGLSNVSVRKRKIHHEEMNDQPCKHEYLIYGRRISDQSVSYYFVACRNECIVKLNNTVKKTYNQTLFTLKETYKIFHIFFVYLIFAADQQKRWKSER